MKKKVIFDPLGKYDLFIWLAMTVLKVFFKPIILINQYDGRSDPECWKDGTKIEFIKSTL
jgi:hypothetical protein